ncbi:putative transporter [Aphelenchoides bicaudatus]|nr:putative transporter [Aphelenchoides bicaudatus]
MDEERPGIVGLLDATTNDYGALSQSSSSFNPTLTTNLDENGTLNSFNNPLTTEEARQPLVQTSPSTMGESPDHILNSYGSFNLFILTNFILMAMVWGLTAMPMMVSAFLLGDVCVNTTTCTPTPGSISEEFELTGGRSKFADLTTMSFLLGNALGANPISWFSDTRGRRAGLILSLTLFGIFGLLSTLSMNVYFFMFFRLCQGLLFPGCGVINWVHAYENSPISLRRWAALVFGLCWVVGYCLLAPIAYAFPNWRHLIIAASLPSLLYAILLFFVMPESFHFLASTEKREELDRWLRSANKVSRNPRLDLNADIIISAHHKNQPHSTESGQRRSIFAELLQKRVLLLYTLILGYLWSCDSFVYYGISLISTLLSGAGSKYWSYALTGLVEIPSYLCSPFLLDLLGRRLFVSICHAITAAAFLGIMFVEDEKWSLILWLIGKFGISCAFTALFVYASEVFPTVIRSRCIGLCIILARVAGLFSPLTRLMTTVNPNLPNIFFTIAAGIGAVVTLFLPETKNKELPDSVSEVEVEALE